MTKQLRVGLVKTDDILFHPHNVRRDLGDLRTLTNSITKYGIMQPVVVEQYGKQLRLRAGHRRVAAAKLAGLGRVPAVIHAEALEEDEWLIQAVQENIERRGPDIAERARAIKSLRDLGCTWAGIADVFGVAEATARGWCNGTIKDDIAAATPATGPVSTRPRSKPRRSLAFPRAKARLIELHREEFERLIAEERDKELDEAVVERCLLGERMETTPAERREVIRRWQAAGRSLNELDRTQGWNVHRDLRPGREAAA